MNKKCPICGTTLTPADSCIYDTATGYAYCPEHEGTKAFRNHFEKAREQRIDELEAQNREIPLHSGNRGRLFFSLQMQHDDSKTVYQFSH